MTVSATRLAGAADGLLEAPLLGDGWQEPLGKFADAAGATGATLVRGEPAGRPRPRLFDEFVLPTVSIAGPVADYVAGLAPPNPRNARSPKLGQGFVTDPDQFSHEELKRNPFYDEFLRPRNSRWHAICLVDSSRELGELHLSLKRSPP